MNGRICGFCVISFNSSINQFLEYCDIIKVFAANFLTNFTFVLQKISKRKFVIIFYSTEVLFSRHSESNRTHIFLEQAVQSLQKISFYEYSGKNSQEGKCSSPKSRQCLRKKIYVMKCCGLCMLRLLSVALVGHFCCKTRQHSLKPTSKKKIMALLVQYHYKREVYCERTV